MTNNVNNNQVLSEKDLGLIREYAARYKQYGILGGRGVEYTRFSQPSSNFNFSPVFGNRFFANDYNVNVENDSSSKRKRAIGSSNSGYNYGIWTLGLVILSAVGYLVYSLPKVYNLSKEYYYTRKIRQLSNKVSNNADESALLKNLKELVKADKSSQFLRNQNVKAFTALGVIAASGAGIAVLAGDFARGVSDFTRDYLPNFMQPSDSLLTKTVELLSDHNLKVFATATAVGSVSLLAFNGIYNLYKDFFYDVENPKMYLHQKAVKIEASLNSLEYNTTSSSMMNLFLRVRNIPASVLMN